MASTREIRIQTDSVHALRRALVRELGRDAAGRALQEAGYAAGDAIVDRLARATDDFGTTPESTFWDRLGGLFREMGWGTIEHEELHPGVGAVVARNWFEVEDQTGRVSAPFSTGVLANILGRIAGEDVAVMQVDCDGGEAGCCRFLFGAGPVLQDVYAALREGRDLRDTLGALR